MDDHVNLYDAQCKWGFCYKPHVLSKVLSQHGGIDLELCKEHLDLVVGKINEASAAMRARTAERESTSAEAEAKVPTGLDRPGYVYYLRVADLIKIGFTTNLWQRTSQYPPNAELLAAEPGTKRVERERHQQFSVYLSRGREWFKPSNEVTQWVETVANTHPRLLIHAHKMGDTSVTNTPRYPRGWTGPKMV